MSTDLQLKGDSRRRQLEASREYADRNGLDLADDAQLEDIGISAFKGANLREGALGRFLEAVEQGAVARGSYLIVESLDRISREHVLAAQGVFLRIIQAGINLVTLTDGRVYRAGETNLGDLVISLVIMSTAHEESLKKSQRVGAAWNHKRLKAAEGTPMTQRCPAWLRLSSDRKAYEIIPARVDIVHRIFEETIAGVGMYSVAKRLNQDRIPAFVGKSGWHQSYIAKTLANRAVLGEFQPHRKVDGKRVPDGDPIPNYYPAIMDSETYFQAQAAKSLRSSGGAGAGRKGPTYTNLFSGLANCAHCNYSMSFENKGATPKGGTYLVCDNARRHLGCEAVRWRYQDFETSFFAFVSELDLESLIDQDAEATQRKLIESEISSLEGQLADIKASMEKTYALLDAGSAVEFVSAKLKELQQRDNECDTKLIEKKRVRDALALRASSLRQSRAGLTHLLERLQGPSGAELYKLRAQIASRLKNLVLTISVATLGDRPKLQRTIEFLEQQPDSEDVISHLKKRLNEGKTARRYFAVGFRNNAVRVVYPRDDDPLKYEEQITDHPGNDKRFAVEYGDK
ncbi:site-specific recombinase [Nitrobacter vulgaris]|uniref:Site-specific recombinase n=2 Tax=Nitrobacter vulgaris TaxID=29421 RepID=A0A1V4I2R9_NITVU|nr:site-specific recombinase [Nitrobacter vulgaris]